MKQSIRILSLIFIMMNINSHYAASNTCEDKNLEVKTTYVPDEFQAEVILNSFLKDQIIDDLTSWFTESHFPYGHSTAWHKINLETSTIDLTKYGINEKLVMVYYQSQNYCGIGGQCSTYLLRNIDDNWKKVDQWHETKWSRVYINSCETSDLYILLDKARDYVADGPDHGRLIKLNL